MFQYIINIGWPYLLILGKYISTAIPLICMPMPALMIMSIFTLISTLIFTNCYIWELFLPQKGLWTLLFKKYSLEIKTIIFNDSNIFHVFHTTSQHIFSYHLTTLYIYCISPFLFFNALFIFYTHPSFLSPPYARISAQKFPPL